MKIAMFTNNYVPHVGGVARSVKTLEDECRRNGHAVRVFAPEFGPEAPGTCGDVLRVPAIRNFHGSDFSVRLPLPSSVHSALLEFAPDLIHSHQPLLMGITALREAWKLRVPIVFTHHTLYEEYIHYLPLLDSAALAPILRRCAIKLANEYSNRCSQIVAPSASVRTLLLERGVTTPIEVIPTGIDTGFFASGDGGRMRGRLAIAPRARVIGHLGRLVQEKNLPFLADAIKQVLQRHRDAVFLLVGDGSALPGVIATLAAERAAGRLLTPGRLLGSDLADAYAAMDIFAFASTSETQGIVLAEAMAAGKPIVALDAPGVRDILRDGLNGIMLARDATSAEFAAALEQLLGDPGLHHIYAAAAKATAEEYAETACAGKVLKLYQRVLEQYAHSEDEANAWDRVLTAVEIEWELLIAKMAVAGAAVALNSAAEVPLE
jgi:1,2-diacylglycerol 3-alpha-glucosyltransferase